jgi:cytochrome c peroxidase
MFARAAAFALLSLSVVPLPASALDLDPSGPSQARRDRWNRAEIAILQRLRLSELPPPADPSNAVHAKPAAAVLGKRLFFEARFSRDQTVSCATCHAPERQFQDDRALGRGLGDGTRRTMPIVGAAFSPWLFWDGRKDSLWSQALGPLEDPAEHATNRTRIAHLVREHHRAHYEAVFGTMPDLAGLPRDASPLGTPDERAAWEAMDSRRRQDVSRVFANVGKAIAAYERTLAFGPSRFDRYVQGVLSGDTNAQAALTVQEVRGLRLFLGAGQCATCHNGPLLTDQHFHNTGVAPRARTRPDAGRADAVSRVQRDEFNCLARSATPIRQRARSCDSSPRTIRPCWRHSRRPACATWRCERRTCTPASLRRWKRWSGTMRCRRQRPPGTPNSRGTRNTTPSGGRSACRRTIRPTSSHS